MDTPRRAFAKLWVATTCSNLSDGIALSVLPLMVLVKTADPLAVSLCVVANRLPRVVLVLFAGVMTDRLDRRNVIAATSFVRAAVFGLLAVSLIFDWLRLDLIYACAFTLSAGESLLDNAAEAMVPAIVSRERLESANSSLFAGIFVANTLVGPPVGAALFGYRGSVPLLLSLLVLLAAGVSVRLMPSDDPSRRRGDYEGVWSDMLKGFRWLGRHKLLRTLALVAGILNLGSTAIIAMVPVYAISKLHLGDGAFGGVLACFGCGSLLGVAFVKAVSRRLGYARGLLLMPTISAIAAAMIGLFANVWVLGSMAATAGFAIACWNVLIVTLRQALVPEEYLGRVGAVWRLISASAAPVGGILGGVVSRILGLQAPFLLVAGLFAPTVVVALTLVTDRDIEMAKRCSMRS